MAAISEVSSYRIFLKYNSRIDKHIKIQLICPVGTTGFKYVTNNVFNGLHVMAMF